MPDLAVAPAFFTVPEYASTNGDLAADVGRQVGLVPDRDQRALLDMIFAENVPGLPALFEVGLIAPRQNMKTAVLQIAALTDLFVMGDELIVWTAHLTKTSDKAFQGLVTLIENTDDFRRRCRKPRMANGDEAIELLNGHKIEFHARSKGGGRGLTGDKVILDEALFLAPSEMGALLPTMATRRGAQVRYASSAGLVTSATLRAVRDRGRRGGDPSLGYVEYCAPRVDCARKHCTHAVGTDGCALDREDLWALANIALGHGRITIEILRKFRAAMPPHEFVREFLGWWDDPTAGAEAKLPPRLWAASADPTSQISGPPSFAIDVTPDRSRASLSVAGLRADGRLHGELIVNAAGTQWLPAAVHAAASGAGARRVILDGTSPAASLIPDLEARGLEVVVASTRDLTQACGALTDLVTAEGFRHIDQAELTAAIAGASTRDLGDGAWAWSRRNSLIDISPLVSLTLAAWGVSQDGPSIYESRGMVIL